MKKKILSILLCAVMLLGVMPATAFAEDAVPTRTDRLCLEKQTTAVDNLAAEGWKWEPTMNGETLTGGILTLKNCYIKTDFCLSIKGNVTIVLEGENVLESTLTSFNAIVDDGNAGNNGLDLTIRAVEGGGKLSILRPDPTKTTDNPYGIAADSLNIQSGDIYCNTDFGYTLNDTNISGGSLTIDAANITDINGLIAYNGDINISDGTVDIKTGREGIVNVFGDINISGGTITLATSNYGIFANTGNVNISEGTLDVTSGSVGIAAPASKEPSNEHLVSITGGNVTVESGLDGINAKSVTVNSTGTVDIDASRNAIRCNYENANLQILAAKSLTLSGDGGQYFPEQTVDNKTVAIANADYSAVDSAIAKIPADLTSYPEAAVQALNNAVTAVIRDKSVMEQNTVNSYAAAIEKALADITKPASPSSPSVSSPVHTITGASSEAEENPNTGAEAGVSLAAALVLLSAAGIATKKRK